MLRYLAVCVAILSCFQLSQPLIVPQELPSILSLIYSNIPQLKKGTDSRLGFGFRLGEHADFQVLVELGPQKDTRPIGDDSSGSSSKRHVNQNDYNAIRRRQSQSSTERTPASWLQNWSNDMRKKQAMEMKQNIRDRNTAAQSSQHSKVFIQTAPMISEASFKQLQLLHRMATTSTESPAPIVVAEVGETPMQQEMQTKKIRKTQGEITDELMDVSLD